MGLVLGKITVETPKYELIHACPDYEIRKYAPSVVAEVTYSPSALGGDRDGGFRILADYIGALGAPRNAKPEKIAMTAPVVTKTSAAAEKIAMTAPVITSGGGGGGGEAVTMQFILPAKYRAAAEAPRPLDERVVVREEAERKYAVARFSGVATEKVVAEKVESLKKSLERDGYKITGEFLLARYNPPWTLPPLRTNEVMIPVE
ncbi:heme-binding-like protein At3g10130, chloroplastic [Ananas comosus]|uniref:Heme-binding-like protein At3g10130, chloroplastic n=1 Tax=Ananas comosus TaxID=4615 RepID=A0A6P5H0M2_ANACO|nr:heme-binding-like protein At3g10130, chloroplastic [Ananas comosus]